MGVSRNSAPLCDFFVYEATKSTKMIGTLISPCSYFLPFKLCLLAHLFLFLHMMLGGKVQGIYGKKKSESHFFDRFHDYDKLSVLVFTCGNFRYVDA